MYKLYIRICMPRKFKGSIERKCSPKDLTLFVQQKLNQSQRVFSDYQVQNMLQPHLS